MASGLLVVAVSLLVLAQGGFFPLVTCGIGAVVCVCAAVLWLRKPCRSRELPVVALLFLGVAAAYAISAFANGASLTTLSEAGVWAACAGIAFLSAAQQGPQRAFWLKVFAWVGVATAVAGVLVCSGLLPLAGGMVEERLQFTFQYANAAAAWFGVCTFLCLLSPDARQRAFAALPAGALLLTESGGGLIAFVACAVAVGVRWVRSSQWERLFQALLQGMVAAVLFVVVRLTLSPVSLAALVAAIAVCWWLGKGASGLLGHVNARTASLVMTGVLVVGAIAAVFLLSGRVTDALASVNERLYHARDGLSLWLTQPLFGVGPDNWQYLYPYTQTAPYYTTVVHCSYVQLLLDAGVIGFAFFVAAAVFGMRGLLRDAKNPASREGWAHAELIAASFLLAHSLLDFNLQFASLAFLLAALLAAPAHSALVTESERVQNAKGETGSIIAKGAKGAKGKSKSKATETVKGAEAARGAKSEANSKGAEAAKGAKGIICALACLLLCLPLSGIGALCASTTVAFQTAEVSGDYAASERLFLNNPLAQADASAQSCYLVACYNQGKYDEVLSVFRFMSTPTDRDVLYVALSHYARNDQAQATSALIKRLEEQPYNLAFLDNALKLTQSYGLDSAQSARFNAAADKVRSNSGS